MNFEILRISKILNLFFAYARVSSWYLYLTYNPNLPLNELKSDNYFYLLTHARWNRGWRTLLRIW